MRAQISELWETGIEIITIAGETFDEDGNRYCDDEITSFADLKKCENVLVDDQEKGVPFRIIIIDDELTSVHFRTVSHPTGCGKLRICEIF